MTSALEDIQKIAEEIKAKQQELQELSKKAFTEGVRKVFETYPFLGAISWHQYTPYFNDGDPCTFRRGEASLFTELDKKKYLARYDSGNPDYDEDLEDHYWEEGHGPDYATRVGFDYDWDTPDPKTGRSYTETPKPGTDQAYIEAAEVVNEIFGAVDDDFFEATFGGHVTVLIPREGDAIVEEYDHD